MTKYQKWICQQSDSIALEEYIKRRIIADLRKDLTEQIKRMMTIPRPQFSGYCEGLLSKACNPVITEKDVYGQ
jgi:hypothetical protein